MYPTVETVSDACDPVRVPLRVLTDDKHLRFALEMQLNGLGYEPFFATDADDLKRVSLPNEPYYLLIDYLLADSDSRALLLDLLESGATPSGLLIMSGFPGFEKIMQKTAERYNDQDIPFFFLEKPFKRAKVGELLLRLGQCYSGKVYGYLSLPKKCNATIHDLGAILREARENLGLSYADVIRAAAQAKQFFTEERLREIEADGKGNSLNASEWMDLSQLLYEFPDSYSIGFEPWSHIRRVRDALEDKTYRFPMNFVLRRKLVELARREPLEYDYPAPALYQNLR